MRVAASMSGSRSGFSLPRSTASSSARDSSKLVRSSVNGWTTRSQRLDAGDRRGLQRGEPAGVDGAVAGALRPGEVDQLAGRQFQLEDALRLLRR